MIKAGCSYQPHLVINEAILAPGGEWTFQSPGWCFMQVGSGAGYWLRPRMYHELATGAALVVSEEKPGAFRARQVAGAVLHFARIIPERLIGLVTLGDQRFLQHAAREDRFAVRFFPPNDPISERFSQLRKERIGDNVLLRVRLLDFFIGSFGEDFGHQQSESADNADAKVRLTKFLEQIVAFELLQMNFSQLVQAMRCTPRHVSRTFQQVMGMSFRDKQAELRLARAQELLATTKAKVLDVALESGYQSVSFLNLMFKRRFGVSPAKWRDQLRDNKCLKSRKQTSAAARPPQP